MEIIQFLGARRLFVRKAMNDIIAVTYTKRHVRTLTYDLFINCICGILA